MKWWHIALIGIGGYFLYTMLKPKVAVAAAGVDQDSELDMLRQTLEGKLKSYGKTISTKVAVEGDQVVFRYTNDNSVAFQVPSSLAPEEIARQIDAI
jgi:hypothetical protein